MPSSYFLSDSQKYNEAFTKYTAGYGSLMRITEAQLFPYQEVTAKQVYDVTGDMVYSANFLYEELNNIRKDDDGCGSFASYVNKNELKTMLAEVVQEYFANVTLKDD